MTTHSFNPISNVYISEYYSEENFNGISYLFAGNFIGPQDIYKTLLKFDISSIPRLCTIQQGILKLYIYRNDNPTILKDIQINRLIDKFNVNTVTYSNQPNYDPSPAAVINITNEIQQYVEWDITDLVRGWYDGSIANNGVVVIGDAIINSIIGFLSSFFNDAREWPFLEVTYYKGISIPLPAENVITSDSFTGTSYELGARVATFNIINTDAVNEALVVVQLSNDGMNWANDAFAFSSYVTVGTGGTIVLNSTGYAQYVRLAYRSAELGSSSSLRIETSITEIV